MACTTCGNQLSPGQRFCPRCGAQQGPPALKTDSLAGYTIENKYRLESLIGLGGMGAVYRARRLMIDDEVAIKLLKADQLSDPQAMERFRREAKAAARLKHPNVVTIYDFGVTGDGLAYLVMELAEGKSLRDLMRETGPMDPQDAAEIISQVCAALNEAHRLNIVHRDLKPDNVIISESLGGLRVKVLDFGIAKLRDVSTSLAPLTQTGMVLGTPQYMSPEQCLGEDLDGRSDIYSLGVVLYEMLVGSLPFTATGPAAVIAHHISKPPISPREANPNLSHAVEQVVMHALEKNRDERPQTAREMAEELLGAVSGSPTAPQAAPRQTAVIPAPTVKTALPTAAEPARVERAPSPNAVPPTVGYGQPYMQPQQPGARRGLMAVAIAVIILALAAIGVVAYLYFFKRPQGGGLNAQTTNAREPASNSARAAETPNSNAATRAGNRSNANAGPAAPDKSALVNEVKATLQSWAGAMRKHDLDAYMANYAEVLEVYYNKQNAYADFVREDKARAFRLFTDLNIQVGNVEVTFDPSGTRAVATFIKTWKFTGDRTITGSVKQEMRLAKVGGRWLITGEKDLDVYTKN